MAIERVLTGHSVKTQSVGKIATFGFSEIENDNILTNNNQRSFVISDLAILDHIKAIEDYIIANKLNTL